MKANLLSRITLILILLFSFTGLLAQFAGGSGTDEDPYLVETAAHLNNVRNYISSSFRQIADIDLGVAPYNQGVGWIPILGQGPSFLGFQGKYNGSGHVISNLIINNTSASSSGFFKITDGAVLDSVSLINVNIAGLNLTGGLISTAYSTTVRHCSVSGTIYSYGIYNGGLIGKTSNNSVITDCHAFGIIHGTGITGGLIGMNEDTNISYSSSSVEINGNGMGYGGLIAYNINNSAISHCFATGNISGVTAQTIGGLIGSNSGTAPIDCCYATGNLSGFTDIGGLMAYTTNVQVSNCYARGNVTGDHDLAGFVLPGSFTLINCYATGFISGNWGGHGLTWVSISNIDNVIHCYYDIQSTGITYNGYDWGRTTDEMTYPYAANTYVDWDFDTIWLADTTGINGGYPVLRANEIINVVSTPIFSPPGGLYYSPIMVSIQCNTPDAVIYYTLDGTDPTEQSTIYSEPFFPYVLNPWEAEVKARAYKTGYIPSAVDSVHYYYPDSNEDDNSSLHPPKINSIYPNPFHLKTDISFSIPKSGKVNLSVYNSKGQLVKVLVQGNFAKGEHQDFWDGTSDNGKSAPSGVYFCRLTGSDFALTRKLMLMK